MPLALAIWLYGVGTKSSAWRRVAVICFLGATLAGLFDDFFRLTLGRPRPDTLAHAHLSDGLDVYKRQDLKQPYFIELAGAKEISDSDCKEMNEILKDEGLSVDAWLTFVEAMRNRYAKPLAVWDLSLIHI